MTRVAMLLTALVAVSFYAYGQQQAKERQGVVGRVMCIAMCTNNAASKESFTSTATSEDACRDRCDRRHNH